MIVTRMQPEDVDNILRDIYPAYFAEAIYNKLTPNMEHARVTVANYLNSFSYVAKEDDLIWGLAVADMGNTFYEEIECDINMFFVHPEARRSGVARAMRDAILEDAKAYNAAVIYTSCLSGISQENEQLYMNLWAKVGFQKLGTVMIRI